ncbi:hypothetical protein FRC05_010393 [Tulasnella sp. 425]|nr:hypothetical protein FRC05_010393 [Tulasnella sp. 425]
MFLQQLRALSWRSTTWNNRETETQKPKACHILNLPHDILEEIIRTHLALTSGNHYLNAIQILSLVHRSWLPTTRYLAYVKLAFIPRNVGHATRMLKHLKTYLPPAPAAHSDDFIPTEQIQRASCRTLFIGITPEETVEGRTVVFELFQLVGHSLRTLELRGRSGSFWKPTEALRATLTHITFLPCLRQMKVLDVGPWTLIGYLCAIWKGDGKRGPGGLIVHHDFELSRERDLLSVPVDILEKDAKPLSTDHDLWPFDPERAWVTHELPPIASAFPTSEEYVPPLEEDNQRPPLELYISRRSHVGEFILTLPQAKFLVNVLKRSVKTVDVWLKDRQEVGTELASAIESKGWERFIDRDIADGETTHSLLHEF